MCGHRIGVLSLQYVQLLRRLLDGALDEVQLGLLGLAAGRCFTICSLSGKGFGRYACRFLLFELLFELIDTDFRRQNLPIACFG